MSVMQVNDASRVSRVGSRLPVRPGTGEALVQRDVYQATNRSSATSPAPLALHGLRRWAAQAVLVAVSAISLPALCCAQEAVSQSQTAATTVTLAPSPAPIDDADAVPHAHDIGRFHAAGDVDDFHARHSQGIDGGDWPADHDDLNGAYVRAELKRNYRVDGWMATQGDADKPGGFAGVEFGALGARSETVGLLTAPFGTLGSRNGPGGSFDSENTVGVSAVRGDAHQTWSLQDGQTTLQVGARGFLGATGGLELTGNLAQHSTPDQPNGFDLTPHAGVGGRVESYSNVKHDLANGAGTFNAEVHTGTEYNLAGQVYGNHDAQSSAFYVWSQQSYQIGSGRWKGVEFDLREDYHPTEPWSRVAAQVQKDIKVHGVDATVGVFGGQEVEHGQHTPMAGIGINFHL